jgi:hypothetical protein
LRRKTSRKDIFLLDCKWMKKEELSFWETSQFRLLRSFKKEFDALKVLTRRYIVKRKTGFPVKCSFSICKRLWVRKKYILSLCVFKKSRKEISVDVNSITR